MLFSLFSVTLAILGARLGSASTSPDFLPAVAEDLQMFYGTTQVQPPGVTLSEASKSIIPEDRAMFIFRVNDERTFYKLYAFVELHKYVTN